MKKISIKKLKDPSWIGKTISLCGWVKTLRHQKNFSFLEINDGTTFSNFQVILEDTLPLYQDIISKLNTGSSICVTGLLVQSPGKNQWMELKAETIQITGSCPGEDYPLQKKRHSFEFLREIAHLRPRTNTQGAVARLRSRLAFETHRFFQERDFIYLNAPIITASDCEGAGQLFQVTTLNLEKVPKTQDGNVDYSQDFFHKKTFLTVSGQLNAEAYACALSHVYTFGPTFRAENSHTSRHLAEFWMIEPEIAFATLPDVMDLAESYVKHLIKEILTHSKEDMAFFDQFIEKGLIERLNHVLNSDFARLSYTEAIEILKKSGRTFEFPHEWGSDLQSEHERYIAEEYCKKPVMITDYPKTLKAFYMRNNDDGKTVAAMDLLVPRIGEIIGGSQREERYDILMQKFLDFKISPQDYKWYLDLRKFGTTAHGGFGLGFERLVQFITGIENIRDVIAFPRASGHADF